MICLTVLLVRLAMKPCVAIDGCGHAGLTSLAGRLFSLLEPTFGDAARCDAMKSHGTRYISRFAVAALTAALLVGCDTPYGQQIKRPVQLSPGYISKGALQQIVAYGRTMDEVQTIVGEPRIVSVEPSAYAYVVCIATESRWSGAIVLTPIPIPLPLPSPWTPTLHCQWVAIWFDEDGRARKAAMAVATPLFDECYVDTDPRKVEIVECPLDEKTRSQLDLTLKELITNEVSVGKSKHSVAVRPGPR